MNTSKNAAWHNITSFAMIAPHLKRTSELICRTLVPSASAEELAPLLEHFAARRGKMIRPGLLLLGGACLGPITDEHIQVAAMVEMIHDATLLHDDVIDEGQTRRGAPTINLIWGNESAVLLGDFVLSQVFRMTAELEPEIGRVVAETAGRVCEGELRQVAQKQNWQLSEAEYISIIADKSASFFSGCCRLGAMLAHAGTVHVDALDRYGLHAGIAFQIVDDLLDISGTEIQTGKTAQCDLNKSKLTLAVIHLLRAVGTSEKESVYAMLDHPGESRQELDTLLQRHGSLDYAHACARRYVHQATEALATLPAGEARDALAEVAHFMAHRAA